VNLEKLFEVDLQTKLAAHPNLLKDVEATFELQIDDKSWHINFQKDRNVKRGPALKADLKIEMKEEVFEKLLDGKLNVTWSLATRKIKVSGNLGLLPKLTELFA